MRRSAAGFALAASVLHVAFVSMHIALMASMTFAGDALASSSRLGFVICAPIRGSAYDDGSATAGAGDDASTATFCPVCAGATSPAVVLPQLPVVPAYVALDTPPAVEAAPRHTIARFELGPIQSRAPPRLT